MKWAMAGYRHTARWLQSGRKKKVKGGEKRRGCGGGGGGGEKEEEETTLHCGTVCGVIEPGT